MRKPLVLAIVLFFSFTSIFAQQSSIKGAVADTTDNKNLQNTLITVLSAKDSTLIKFTRADRSGNFSIPAIDSGNFIVMITHPYLGDYFDKLQVKPASVNDLGKIILIPKSKLLAEVIVKSGSPIKIKGDTTVYTADSFKVREGANVEELLRRLPGIQVDKDGKITAMGERVKKVLVDGEEFFGTDPGIATKNLRADIVKEVEVFDKKSDQAEFTGIDDGVKDKTINLKLKDDKKKGYFGKAEAGGGLKDKYNNSLMLNAFKGKRKLAGYGIMSNTGQTNLDWNDASNYGGGMEGMETGFMEDGGMFISIGGGDDYNSNSGIPRNWNGGLHYSNKYNNNKQSFNAGYKYSKINSPGVTTTFSKMFLPDTSWSTNSRNDNFTSTIKHALNMTVDLTLDSMNTLKWTTRGNNNRTIGNNKYYTESFSDDGDSINNSTRKSNSDVDKYSLTSSLLWRHKFKKLARTLSVNTDVSWNKTTSDGLLYGLNNFYRNGIIDHRDTTDQQNIAKNEGKSISTKISYTEPLMKDTYLEFNYSLSYNTNNNERITNRDDGTGKYDDKIDSLSNSFVFNRLVNTPGINFRVNKKKYGFSFGTSVGFSHFTQKNLTDNTNRKLDYTNFFPRASFNYKIKPSENLRFGYNGSTTAPTLEQLQPIRVNTDPLNIYIGNPDLNQSFRHSFDLSYNSFNVLKERNIFSYLSFSTTQNAFTQSSEIGDGGKRTYKTVNVDGVYNMNMFFDYGFKIPDTKWRMGFGPNININRNIDFVSDQLSGKSVKNVTNTRNYGISVNISQYVPDKYDFRIGPGFSWNTSKASVNTTANAAYWQASANAGGNVVLPGKINLGTDISLQMRQKDKRFPANNNFTTWNAFVIKRIMKNELEFKLGLYDILNQNRGYNRSFDSYSFTETYNNTLKRFWLLSVTWNISKNGKPAGFGF